MKYDDTTLLVRLPVALSMLFAASAGCADPLQQASGFASVRQDADGTSGTKVMPPYVRLYEGHKLTQDTVCSVPLAVGEHKQYHFQEKEGHCANDEAKSIEFERIPAGTVVELFDDPKCGKGDDWVSFTFRKLVPRTWAWGFEYDLEDKDYGDGEVVYSKVYHKDNGLDGKVSCMIINVPPEH
ncbi:MULTISPECIES: hypothetical protein [Rhodanobacteraceae]|uniref:hypothetical protein n=1 Tax=Rhodanobacteraceae TaxID=1775411 RepID=UPI0008841FBA|nr:MULTISPECIES: hypothetical protein [Rhodanobacteraceae]SDF16222.1 hypothetical protein SAMN04515659_0286 [Dyella sp. 333MFSha]SKB82309.1 hypothetical protein SAMN05660880_02785 [Luteibacter sp. 22Crub2.1]